MNQGQLHQCRETIGRDLPLHRLDIARPLFVLASCDAEEGVKEVNEAIPIDRG